MPIDCDGAGGCEQLRASQIRDARGQLIAKTHRLQRFWAEFKASRLIKLASCKLLETTKKQYAARIAQTPPARPIMILTTCAACAAPLAHTAPRCVRCHTRYCNQTCQHDHWRRGHKQICKRIHRGGNAEQYHADKKYKEAVAVAVEKCAEDTKGQTC